MVMDHNYETQWPIDASFTDSVNTMNKKCYVPLRHEKTTLSLSSVSILVLLRNHTFLLFNSEN